MFGSELLLVFGVPSLVHQRLQFLHSVGAGFLFVFLSLIKD